MSIQMILIIYIRVRENFTWSFNIIETSHLQSDMADQYYW